MGPSALHALLAMTVLLEYIIHSFDAIYFHDACALP